MRKRWQSMLWVVGFCGSCVGTSSEVARFEQCVRSSDIRQFERAIGVPMDIVGVVWSGSKGVVVVAIWCDGRGEVWCSVTESDGHAQMMRLESRSSDLLRQTLQGWGGLCSPGVCGEGFVIELRKAGGRSLKWSLQLPVDDRGLDVIVKWIGEVLHASA